MSSEIVFLSTEDLGLASGGKGVKLPASAIHYLGLVEKGIQDVLAQHRALTPPEFNINSGPPKLELPNKNVRKN